MTFEEFTRSRLPPLLRFAKVLCGDVGLAEDVVQEVLIRAHARWAHIGDLDKPEAYLRRMIINEFISWRRKWARVTPVSELDWLAPTPDHANHHAERQELVERLNKLPPRQRTVIVLRYYIGLPDSDIAVELGCSASTVRSNAARALAALRVSLRAAELLHTREV